MYVILAIIPFYNFKSICASAECRSLLKVTNSNLCTEIYNKSLRSMDKTIHVE